MINENLNIIDSIEIKKNGQSKLNEEAVTIDELTGEVIEINYDVITGNNN